MKENHSDFILFKTEDEKIKCINVEVAMFYWNEYDKHE